MGKNKKGKQRSPAGKKNKVPKNREILNRRLVNYSIINGGMSADNFISKRIQRKMDDCFDKADCKKDDCFNGIDIEYLRYNLPLLPFVLQQIIMFVHRVPLKCETDGDTEKLRDFLNSNNIDGVTNKEVLLNSMFESMIYGRNGIRFLSIEDGLVSVPYKNYDVITSIDDKYPTRDIIQAYYIRRDGETGSIIQLNDIEPIADQVARMEGNSDYSEVISTNDFVNLRWFTNAFFPKSPLTYDSQRIRVILTFYQSLIDKLNENGVGRLLFQLSEDYVGMTNSDMINGRDTKETNDRFANHIKNIAQKFADEVRHSDPDVALVIPEMFDKDVQHFENNADPSSLMDLFKFEELVIPEVYGFPPSLLGLGTLSDRNVSIAATNATAEATTVVSLRDKFCSQFAPLLERHLEVSDITFDNEFISTRAERLETDATVAKTAELLTKAGYEKTNEYIEKELSK